LKKADWLTASWEFFHLEIGRLIIAAWIYMAITDPQMLKKIADKLSLFGNITPLNIPVTNGLKAKLDPIASNPKFADMGIGVVDFSNDAQSPLIWLHQGDEPWWLVSTAKICILLAAVQLRADVRTVKSMNVGVSTEDDFDELFATVWTLAEENSIRAISVGKYPPRISRIFDLAQTPIDFWGAGAFVQGLTGFDGNHPVAWPDLRNLEFYDRMVLTGEWSDNVAATSCVSEIGVDYMKAVLQAHGLFDGDEMHLWLSTGYKGKKSLKPRKDIDYRGIREPLTPQKVINPLAIFEKNEARKRLLKEKGHRTTVGGNQAGSASALTAYVIALVQNNLIGRGQDPSIGKSACDTIRACLGDYVHDPGHGSAAYEGVRAAAHSAGASIDHAYTKVGYDPLSDVGAGPGAMRAEFNYFEVGPLKFGLVAAGIAARIEDTAYDNAEALGAAVYDALRGP
jgi:hypothetical protein